MHTLGQRPLVLTVTVVLVKDFASSNLPGSERSADAVVENANRIPRLIITGVDPAAAPSNLVPVA